jgi:hypothetical protein
MTTIEISDKNNFPTQYIKDFLKSKNIVRHTYDELNHNDVLLITESLMYLKNNLVTWHEEQQIIESNKRNKLFGILNNIKSTETNYLEANILNIANMLNIESVIINEWLNSNGYTDSSTDLSKSAFIEIKSVFDKNDILDKENFSFSHKDNIIRKKTNYSTDEMFRKLGLKIYQDILERIYSLEINGNLTRYDKDEIKVIIYDAIDVLFTHLNSGSFKQQIGESYIRDVFGKIKNIIVIGRLDVEEFEIIKHLFIDSLKFWYNYDFETNIISYKYNEEEKLENKIEYCSSCDNRPCRCHIIAKEKAEIEKFNKRSYRQRDYDYDEDSRFCGACESRPCICSDPERTCTYL